MKFNLNHNLNMGKSVKSFFDDIARTAKRALSKESAQKAVSVVSKAVVDAPSEVAKLFTPDGLDATVQLVAFGNSEPLKDMYSESSAMDAVLTASRLVQGTTIGALKTSVDAVTTGKVDVDALSKTALDIKYLVENEGWTREQVEAREAYHQNPEEAAKDAKNFLIRSGVDAGLAAAEVGLLASSTVTANPAVGVVGSAALGGLMKANRSHQYV